LIQDKQTGDYNMINYIKKGKQEGDKKEFLQQVKTTVENIIEDIEANGDKAVAQYSEKFDK
jgi:sulfopropanediol 3-dehydrogenase